jgi:Stigma-specific protein, Stig1
VARGTIVSFAAFSSALACGGTSKSHGVEASTGGHPAAVGGANSGQAGQESEGGTPVAGGATGAGAVAGTTTGGGASVGGCDRCRGLPHVRADAAVVCRDGECVYAPESCEDGFEHCVGRYSDVGCESALSSPETCGRCSQSCDPRQVCLVAAGYVCSTCSFPSPVACRNACSDLQNDHANCGTCGNTCLDTQVCQGGACVDCDEGLAACGGLNLCDSWLLDSAHCGSCGQGCSDASRFGWCDAAAECQALSCRPGLADCDSKPADCETELATTTGCGPTFLRTTTLASDYDWLATTSDGSSLARNGGGLYRVAPSGDVAWSYSLPDADVYAATTTADGLTYAIGHRVWVTGEDAAYSGVFVAQLGADGQPRWTRELVPNVGAGQAIYEAMAVDDAGRVFFAASLSGEVDVDPTPLTDLQSFPSRETWLFELTPQGELASATALAGGDCSVRVEHLAFQSGKLLMTGSAACELGDGAARPNGDSSSFVARLGAAGQLERVRWLGDVELQEGAFAVDLGGDGLALSGTVFSELRLDDSAPVLASVHQPRAFVARFSSSLDLSWLKVSSGVKALAPGPDGAVLAMMTPEPSTFSPLLTLWRSDGSSAWSMEAGCHYVNALGPSGAGFAVRATGLNSNASCDLDPGPSTATTPEGQVVIQYAY